MAPLCSSWMWKVLPRCAREITSRRFRKQIIAWRKDYGRTAIRFVLIVTVAIFAAAAGAEADLPDSEWQRAGDGLGEQYGRSRSRDSEEWRNSRIRQWDRNLF